MGLKQRCPAARRRPATPATSCYTCYTCYFLLHLRWHSGKQMFRMFQKSSYRHFYTRSRKRVKTCRTLVSFRFRRSIETRLGIRASVTLASHGSWAPRHFVNRSIRAEFYFVQMQPEQNSLDHFLSSGRSDGIMGRFSSGTRRKGGSPPRGRDRCGLLRVYIRFMGAFSLKEPVYRSTALSFIRNSFCFLVLFCFFYCHRVYQMDLLYCTQAVARVIYCFSQNNVPSYFQLSDCAKALLAPSETPASFFFSFLPFFFF